MSCIELFKKKKGMILGNNFKCIAHRHLEIKVKFLSWLSLILFRTSLDKIQYLKPTLGSLKTHSPKLPTLQIVLVQNNTK